MEHSHALRSCLVLGEPSQQEGPVEVEVVRRAELRDLGEVLWTILQRVSHGAQEHVVGAGLPLLHRLDQRECHRPCADTAPVASCHCTIKACLAIASPLSIQHDMHAIINMQ